jgi:hypothetical protein
MFGLGQSILEHWAKTSGFELLSSEKCWVFKGPFFFTATRPQDVFRFTVRDAEGRIRSGYARCGGFWLGTLTDHIDVRWDS